MSDSKSGDRYHHGDLRNALIEAAVALVREAGPDAIVLREVARRVGVTANAAYRHFDGLPDLVEAVRQAGFDALSASMLDELGRLVATGDAPTDAIFRLRAVGRGYIHFALAEPGLFALAFSQYQQYKQTNHAYVATDPPDASWNLLNTALDGLVEVGVLAPDDRAAAVTNAWATVHGLSVLLLGPMAGVPDEAARDQIIDTTLGLVMRGLARRPDPLAPAPAKARQRR